VRFLGVSVAVLALAVAGAACGSDKGSTPKPGGSTTPGNAVSKAAYISELNGVCNKRMAVVRKLRTTALKKLGANPTPREIADVTLNVVIPEKRNVLKHMRAVTPPIDDESTVLPMFVSLKNAFDKQAAALKKNPTAKESFGDFRNRALAYGLSAHCRDVPTG
jgi:hypothetical protein